MSGPDDELLEQWRLELQRLGEQLLMAGTAANWELVRELDRRIAGILRKLQQSPKLKTLLAERLVILQQQHHQVFEMCRASHDELAKTMQSFNSRQDGLRAYEESQKWR